MNELTLLEAKLYTCIIPIPNALIGTVYTYMSDVRVSANDLTSGETELNLTLFLYVSK